MIRLSLNNTRRLSQPFDLTAMAWAAPGSASDSFKASKFFVYYKDQNFIEQNAELGMFFLCNAPLL